MTDLPLPKMFEPDTLVPSETAEEVRRGDRVSFELADGSVIAFGHVVAIAEGGAVKVRIEQIGAFLIPPGYCSVIERAQ